MPYNTNEAYNKQTSNEGFWQSAGMGIGIGAATAAGIAGAAHGTSYGMMRYGKNTRDKAQVKAAENMAAAFNEMDSRYGMRDLEPRSQTADFTVGNDGPTNTISKGHIDNYNEQIVHDRREYDKHAPYVQETMKTAQAEAQSRFENSKSNRMHKKGFGGGKRALATYGSSALLGALTGGTIDYFKD